MVLRCPYIENVFPIQSVAEPGNTWHASISIVPRLPRLRARLREGRHPHSLLCRRKIPLQLSQSGWLGKLFLVAVRSRTYGPLFVLLPLTPSSLRTGGVQPTSSFWAPFLLKEFRLASRMASRVTPSLAEILPTPDWANLARNISKFYIPKRLASSN